MRDNKKRTKRIAIVLACILIPVGAFGFGYFWNRDSKDNQVANTLSVNGNITGSITEDADINTTGMVPGDEVKSTININPTSTTDSLLRVKVKPYWKNSEGKEDSKLSSSNLELITEGVTDSITDNKWYKEGEYYYYIGKVNSKTNEINLIKGIKFLVLNNESESYKVNDYQDKQVGIEVTMEMVQCSYNAYSGKWNSGGNSLSKDLNNKLDELSPEGKMIN